MKITACFLVVWITTTAWGASRNPANAYTIQGIVELQSLRGSKVTNGFYYDFETNYFDLQVKDCRWLVKLGSQRPEVYDYRIVSSDGASTFNLLSYETRHQRAFLAGEKIGSNIGEGSVFSGNMPRFSLAPEAGAVWIAYASGCHFAEDPYSRRRPIPFVDYISTRPISRNEPLPVESTFWQCSSSPPHLPTMLVYVAEKQSPGESLPDATFTNVVYEPRSFIEVDGLSLPKEAVLSVYRLFPSPGSGTKQLCYQIRVVETNIISGTELESFRPKLPGKTIISDNRFNNGRDLNLAYFSDNQWPSEASARNSDAYREANDRLGDDAPKFLTTGTDAPEMGLESLNDRRKGRLADYKGRLAVLEFWATWCGPCQTAMAEAQTYLDKYPDWKNRVVLLSLNVDEDRETAAKHVDRKGWHKTENFWVKRDDVKRYSFVGIPMVYIIDQQGKIVAAGHDLDIPKKVNELLSLRTH
jgi:thiol-disulfide isomerase/thioredoxin